jgi:hypothetical protein
VWAPNVLRTVGDVVEPTVFNSYRYTVVSTLGANSAQRHGRTDLADRRRRAGDRGHQRRLPTPTADHGRHRYHRCPEYRHRYTNPGGSTPGLTSTGLSL